MGHLKKKTFESNLRKYYYIYGVISYVASDFIIFENCRIFEPYKEHFDIAYSGCQDHHYQYVAVKMDVKDLYVGENLKLFAKCGEDEDYEYIEKQKLPDNIFFEDIVFNCVEVYDGPIKFGLRRNYNYELQCKVKNNNNTLLDDDCSDKISCSGILKEINEHNALFSELNLNDCDWFDSWIEDTEEDVIIYGKENISNIIESGAKEGSIINFSGDVCQYIDKDGEVNYGIKSIEIHGVQTQNDLNLNTAKKIICDTCWYYDKCDGLNCIRNQDEVDVLSEILANSLKKENIECECSEEIYSETGHIKGCVEILEDIRLDEFVKQLTNTESEMIAIPVCNLWIEQCDILLDESCHISNIGVICEYFKFKKDEGEETPILSQGDVFEFDGIITKLIHEENFVGYDFEQFSYVKKISQCSYHQRKYAQTYATIKEIVLSDENLNKREDRNVETQIQILMDYAYQEPMWVKEQFIFQTVPIAPDFYENRYQTDLEKEYKRRLESDEYIIHKYHLFKTSTSIVNSSGKHNNIKNDKWRPLAFEDVKFKLIAKVERIGSGYIQIKDSDTILRYESGDREMVNFLIDTCLFQFVIHHNDLLELNLKEGDEIVMKIDMSENGNAKLYENKYNGGKISAKVKLNLNDMMVKL